MTKPVRKTTTTKKDIETFRALQEANSNRRIKSTKR